MEEVMRDKNLVICKHRKLVAIQYRDRPYHSKGKIAGTKIGITILFKSGEYL